MAIIKPNNNTISAITALPAAITTGKVLQVVQGSTTYSKTNSTQDSYTDAESSSGTTWVTSITPTSTSNKILIIASLMTNCYESSSEGDQRGHVAVLGDINGAGYSTFIIRSLIFKIRRIT